MAPVVDPVAVEVDYVVGAAGLPGPEELFLQGIEGRRREEGQLGELPQGLQGLHHGPRAHPVVDVARPLVLRPRAHQEHPDRRRRDQGLHRPPVRQAAAHPDPPGTLEQVAPPVVDQLPGQAQEKRRRLLHPAVGLFVGILPGHRLRVHQDREPPHGSLRRPPPGLERLPGGLGQERTGQVPAPLGEGRLDAPGALPERPCGPLVVALQVPGELAGLDLPEGRGEDEAGALDLPLTGTLRRLVDQAPGGPSPAGAAPLPGLGDLRVPELQGQLCHLGGRLRHGFVPVLGRPETEGGQEVRQELGHGPGGGAVLEGHRFVLEEERQDPVVEGIDQDRDHPIAVVPALAGLEGAGDLLLHPRGAHRPGAQEDHEVPGLLDRPLDLGLEGVAAHQLPGVGPRGNPQPFQGLPKGGDIAIVLRRVGDEDMAGHLSIVACSSVPNHESSLSVFGIMWVILVVTLYLCYPDLPSRRGLERDDGRD